MTDQPSEILENFERPYLGNGSSDPLHVWFYGRVFGVGGSNGAYITGWTKSTIAAVSCSGSWNEQITTLGQAETRTARIVSDCAGNAAEVGRPGASDTVKSQCSNFELYPLRHWQPMEDVTKNRCDVLVFIKTDNETSGGVEYHFVVGG